jgi:multiple sugar transport system ATP-binding protein
MGRIEQLATPKEIYENPRSKFVASFIGTPSMNFIEMAVSSNGANFLLTNADTHLAVSKERYNLQDRQTVTVGIRPAHLLPAPEGSDHNIIAGVVDLVEYLGNEALVNFQLGSVEIGALLDSNACPQLKQPCRLTVDERHIHIFDRESEQTLIRDLSCQV